MYTIIARDESGVDVTTEYTGDRKGLSAAMREAAQNYVDSGDYGDCDRTRTLLITVYVRAEDVDGEEVDADSYTIDLDPEVPACDGHEHDWRDGPVRGHGGGVIYTDTCRHCGLTRTTDTWATNPSNGTQGHTVVRYDAAE